MRGLILWPCTAGQKMDIATQIQGSSSSTTINLCMTTKRERIRDGIHEWKRKISKR